MEAVVDEEVVDNDVDDDGRCCPPLVFVVIVADVAVVTVDGCVCVCVCVFVVCVSIMDVRMIVSHNRGHVCRRRVIQ